MTMRTLKIREISNRVDGSLIYSIVVEKTETGFSAYSPDLPGCIATGSTQQEVEKKMGEAIEFHFEGLFEKMIERGLKDSEEGNVISHEEVRKRIKSWSDRT